MKEQALVLREQAKNQLLEIKTVDEAVSYINKVKAIETYCKAVKEDNEIVKIVAEQKIRSMRLAGQLLEATELQNGARGNSSNQFQKEVELPNETPPTLNELGITKRESSTYQKLASIPEEVFEVEMQKAKEGDSTNDITVSRFKRITQDNAISQKLSHEKAMLKYSKLLKFKNERIHPDLIILYKRKGDLETINKLFN